MAHQFRKIKGIGENRAKRLREAGIETIEDLIRLNSEKLEEISKKTNIGVGTLKEYQAKARKLLPEVAEEVRRMQERQSWFKRVWDKIAS